MRVASAQRSSLGGGVAVNYTDDVRVTARFFMFHRNARAVLKGLAGKYCPACWPLKALPGCALILIFNEIRTFRTVSSLEFPELLSAL